MSTQVILKLGHETPLTMIDAIAIETNLSHFDVFNVTSSVVIDEMKNRKVALLVVHRLISNTCVPSSQNIRQPYRLIVQLL